MKSTSKYYQQLQPEDQVTISSLKQQNISIRGIARLLKRSPSTISRELERNGHRRSLRQRRSLKSLSDETTTLTPR